MKTKPDLFDSFARIKTLVLVAHSFLHSANTCEYHAAKCQRKVPADAQHVPCDAPTMVSD